MSIEAAKGVLEKLKTDEEFKAKVLEAEISDRIGIVKDAGFDCTFEELQEVASQLSEDDLEAVAGGANLTDDFSTEGCIMRNW